MYHEEVIETIGYVTKKKIVVFEIYGINIIIINLNIRIFIELVLRTFYCTYI